MKLESQQQFETSPSALKILAITWNLVGTIPAQKYLHKFFSSPPFAEDPDIIFIGTQQCEISLFWAFFWDSKPQWEAVLKKHLVNYYLLTTISLQGLHSAVLVSNRHNDQAIVVNRSVLRAGFCCGLIGNKGAVELKIKIYGKYIQFINCHLAPHQSGVHQRNQTLIKIAQNMVCPNTSTQVILLGDMNYRLQIKNQQYKQFLQTKKTNTEKKVHYQEMIAIQQLRNQELLKQRFFPLFDEGDIRFPPTYKMNIQDEEYARSRVPGWTDRIFCRKGKIARLSYDCLYNVYGSDHRPVFSTYEIQIDEGLSLFEDQTFQARNCQLI